MRKIVYILSIILIMMVIMLVIRTNKEYLIIPGVYNRQDINANFIDDRDWFDIAERSFYGRYHQ